MEEEEGAEGAQGEELAPRPPQGMQGEAEGVPPSTPPEI